MFRFLVFIAIALSILWGWPTMFQKPAVDMPPSLAVAEFSDVERQYYREVFDYAMETVPANGMYAWQTSSGIGKIYVGASFKSKSGSTCRSFNEQYTIAKKQDSNDGVACKREGRNGWCRLKKTDALTCAMEPPGNLFEKATQNTQGLIEAGKDLLGKAKGFLR
jgi:hypothetical protein